MTSLFAFPDPVNEKAARTVAAGVLLLAGATLVLSLVAGSAWLWLTVPLAYGFLARVLTGPTLSPLGQLASRLIAPRLGPSKPVPGPPKRFAQGMGAAITSAAALSYVAFDAAGAAQILLGMVVVAATLEAVLAVCVGCTVFAGLMRIGVIPAGVCIACADVSQRPAEVTAPV